MNIWESLHPKPQPIFAYDKTRHDINIIYALVTEGPTDSVRTTFIRTYLYIYPI